MVCAIRGRSFGSSRASAPDLPRGRRVEQVPHLDADARRELREGQHRHVCATGLDPLEIFEGDAGHALCELLLREPGLGSNLCDPTSEVQERALGILASHLPRFVRDTSIKTIRSGTISLGAWAVSA
jgi:hypothetical protein